MTKDQRLQRLREEEQKASQGQKPGKEERLRTAQELKRIWMQRAEEESDQRVGSREVPTEEDIAAAATDVAVTDARELGDEEMMNTGEYLETGRGTCMSCAMDPCVCLLLYT